MGRTTWAAGLIAMMLGPVGHAGEYVPGKTRDDGLYLPPHFRGAGHMVEAAEAWFDALPKKDPLGDPGKLPPAAAGAPPAPPLPAQTSRR